MNIRRTLGSVVLVGLTLACAGCKPTMSTKDAMASWMGHDANLLIEQWGPPSRTFVMPNGNTMYTWAWSRERHVIAGNVITGGTQWCEKTFTVNPEGIVIRWSYRNC